MSREVPKLLAEVFDSLATLVAVALLFFSFDENPAESRDLGVRLALVLLLTRRYNLPTQRDSDG